MSYLKRLKLENFRNFDSFSLIPTSRGGLIHGDNGVGKTSLLEAIYYMTTVSSFRTSSHQDIIQRHKPYFSLFGEFSDELKVGILRNHRKSQAHEDSQKVNGNKVYRKSEIVENFATLIITPAEQRIITDSAQFRRKLFDWGVFHVEPNFLFSWRKWHEMIRKRNAWLKSFQFKGPFSSSILDEVDKSLVHETVRLLFFRFKYAQAFKKTLNEYIDVFFQGRYNFDVFFDYGFDNKTNSAVDSLLISCGKAELMQLLLDNYLLMREKDIALGFSRYGLHRYDLLIKEKENNILAKKLLSRGEQRLLLIALKLTQVTVLYNLTKKTSILLIDDMFAELDKYAKERFLEGLLLVSDMCQLFLACVSVKDSLVLGQDFLNLKMFHVKH